MTATEMAAMPDPRELQLMREQAKREMEPFNDIIYKLSVLIRLKYLILPDGTLERVRDDEIENKIDEIITERDAYIKKQSIKCFRKWH